MRGCFLANRLWQLACMPDAHAFERALRQPRAIQETLLKHCLIRNADTAFGREHGFAGIHSIRDFQVRVPLRQDDEFLPYFDRVATGEPRVLTREPVRLLEPTSGSSRAAKLIPYTATLKREFNRAIAPWMADLFRQYPSLRNGSAYWSITPARFPVPSENTRIPIGFETDSAYLGGLSRWLADSVMAVPGDVRRIQDMDRFRYVTLRHLLLHDDLRLMSVWHPSFLTLLLEQLPVHWEHLLADIAECRPGRARWLETLDPEDTAALWPHLQLISCWGDGQARFHLDAVRRWVPHAAIQPKGLIATEAFISLPCAGRMPLAVRSHFFEFVDEDGRVFLADELRLGGQYEVAVTTGGGLNRYRMGDWVEVTGWLQNTPSLRFLGRAGGSDRYGEKLSERFVGSVLDRLYSARRPAFAMLAPDEQDGCAFYTLFEESDAEAGTSPERLNALLMENPHYAYCLHLGQLAPARVFRIRAGGVAAYLARQAGRGQRLGNIKPTALSGLDGWKEYFEGAYLFN